MTHYAAASTSFAFDMRMAQCDVELQQLLKEKVTVKPALFANLTLEAPGSDKTSKIFCTA